mmetsp:Transcript_104820/g.303374  ORF Transcript_104820/g.303374 Transcript_104820/m.303374 type:complete len:227 (+) Transcript_104820:1854-2534(+)
MACLLQCAELPRQVLAELADPDLACGLGGRLLQLTAESGYQLLLQPEVRLRCCKLLVRLVKTYSELCILRGQLLIERRAELPDLLLGALLHLRLFQKALIAIDHLRLKVILLVRLSLLVELLLHLTKVLEVEIAHLAHPGLGVQLPPLCLHDERLVLCDARAPSGHLLIGLLPRVLELVPECDPVAGKRQKTIAIRDQSLDGPLDGILNQLLLSLAVVETQHRLHI